jgi:hypothetical protein
MAALTPAQRAAWLARQPRGRPRTTAQEKALGDALGPVMDRLASERARPAPPRKRGQRRAS